MDNQKAYQEKYSSGYGLRYPDGIIIRVTHQIFKYELDFKGGNILDYGCGNGVHIDYLNSVFPSAEIYGLDTSEQAIEVAKENNPEFSSYISTCSPVPKIDETFKGVKFDLIICNQVLYYLNDENAKNIIEQFYDVLNPGGALYVSWMGVENFYFGKSTEEKEGGFRRVELSGRLNETTFINFKTKKEFLDLFSDKYKTVQDGYYDAQIRQEEGSTMHYFFVGNR